MAEKKVTQKKEIRFAVVMYGGVSLAIYINGVAQELYHLVRATATRVDGAGDRTYLFPEEKLTGAGKVYRALGEMLDARFVVDILSGTSAGGINAVFLAKALANCETFEQLQHLWIQEGDIGVLINDKASALSKEGLKLGGEPASLLNSQRMYYKLLYALDTMDSELEDNGNQKEKRSPYVDELDLFVTATDIRGLVQKTRLSGGETNEYRHKNVFRFRYATEEAAGGDFVNDFVKENSPFLAFAARCTSAFPFAFEPMRLDDIKAVVEAPYFHTTYKYDPAQWKKFYKDYLGGEVGFEKRSFGDGGYLDNKPFSYVTETLLRRRADLPVDRKLIYIEPAPEHPSETDVDVRPDPLQNVGAALLTLPRYETIREDLGLILERNRMIERVETIMKHIRHASQASLRKNVDQWQMSGTQWAGKYLDDEMLTTYGPGYAAYHQLRVASVLDELAAGLVRAMGLDEDSETARNFRPHTLEGWREAYYRIDPAAGDARKSENDLLFRMDISWRIRRLQFIQNLIDDLLAGLEDITPGTSEEAARAARERAREIVRDSLEQKDANWPFAGQEQGEPEARAAYRQALLKIKAGLNAAYKDLRAGGRLLRSRDFLSGMEQGGIAQKGGEQTAEEANLLAYGQQLRALKEALDTDADKKTVYAHLEELSNALASGEARPKVKGALRSLMSANAGQCKQILGYDETQAGASARKTVLERVQACLSYYYNRFEYYDMLIYPLFFGSEVGESDVVEIIRVSPEDAPSLRPPSQKLAGTKLGNFGAFFVREWRENDILWGRLDGAECLINAMLPGEEHAGQREVLIRQAQQGILEETFLVTDRARLFASLISSQGADAEGAKAVLSQALGGPNGVLERLQRDYMVDQEFPPETTLQFSGRASQVIGKMLSALSSKYPPALTNPVGLLAFLGRVFSSLVQLALPQSIPNLLFKTIVWMLYPLELLLIVGGGLAGLSDVSTAGFVLLGMTLSAHIAVLTLQAYLKKKLPAPGVVRGALLAAAVLVVVAVCFLAYLGLVSLGALPKVGGLLGSWLPGPR